MKQFSVSRLTLDLPGCMLLQQSRESNHFQFPINSPRGGSHGYVGCRTENAMRRVHGAKREAE